MIVLIDGDILIFKLAFRHQHKFEFGVVTDDLNVVKEDMDKFISSIVKATGADDYQVCLTSWTNFRKKLKESYKIHRKDQEKPKLLPALRNYLIEAHQAFSWKNIEADDMMGILSTREPGKYIIASTDKDLNQIPGKHYSWTKDESYEISPYEGYKFFYSQILTGDRADGYTGVKGIGVKRAAKLLEGKEVKEMWDVVVEAYEKAGMTEEDAISAAQMAWILRDGWYDEETGEVQIWTPDKITTE